MELWHFEALRARETTENECLAQVALGGAPAWRAHPFISTEDLRQDLVDTMKIPFSALLSTGSGREAGLKRGSLATGHLLPTSYD